MEVKSLALRIGLDVLNFVDASCYNVACTVVALKSRDEKASANQRHRFARSGKSIDFCMTSALG